MPKAAVESQWACMTPSCPHSASSSRDPGRLGYLAKTHWDGLNPSRRTVSFLVSRATGELDLIFADTVVLPDDPLQQMLEDALVAFRSSEKFGNFEGCLPDQRAIRSQAECKGASGCVVRDRRSELLAIPPSVPK